MSLPTSLSTASRLAFRDCLDGLHEDLELLRLRIQEQLAEAVGRRAGDWFSQTLSNVLGDGSSRPATRSLGEPDDGLRWDSPQPEWFDHKDRAGVRQPEPVSETPLTVRTLGLGIAIHAISWWLDLSQKRYSKFAVPLLTLLGSWLCDRLNRAQ